MLTSNYFILEIDPQGFAFGTGKTFRGLTLSERSDGWNVILRAYDRDNTAIYAMNTAEEPGEGLQHLLDALEGRDGEGLWHKDKFAK